ncbi:MAG: polyphosphate kinase 2 family protein [Flavobacteriaceae bacterium]|nr:polyphosphate kinase 2 family protein [Flavobacteriaceae bacterium]
MKKEVRKQFVNEVMNRCKVDKQNVFTLSDHDTAWSGTEDIRKLGEKKLKKKAKKILKDNLKELSEAQELLYATGKKSILLIFQAMDAAGKDGTIKHVMSGVNPQGCQVFGFKKPSTEELAHNFLWRYTKRMPELGRIGIFNRSYYEEVLVLKVNPELLQNSNPDDTFWNERYADLNNLEKHLTQNGTVVLKFFLNVSKDEQRNRFLERLNDSEKHWKFSDSDLVERAKWDHYQNAFEDAINATATEWAPWYVIPADNKWVMRTIVSTIVTESISSLKLESPKVSAKKKRLLDDARKQLENGK